MIQRFLMRFSGFALAILTLVALSSMAANGVLSRLAISHNWAHAFTFSILRLLSGMVGFAVVMWVLHGWRTGSWKIPGSWWGAFTLTGCVVAFSAACAWTEISAGVLVMFAMVQLTLLTAAGISGERLDRRQILGMLIAGGGLIFLSAPGQTAPSWVGVVLMVAAGVSWALYSLSGRNETGDSVQRSAGNLMRTLPAVALLWPLAAAEPSPNLRGIACGIACGALMTGFGYSLWYVVQQRMTGIQASLVQLLVPVLAALGGILFLSEPLTLRLVGASALILGGVALTMTGDLRVPRLFTGKTGTRTGSDRSAGARPARWPRS